MPFKGDENMLVDAKDRAALDEDEGDNQLLMGFDSGAQNTGNGATAQAVGGESGGLLDLDMMLGSSSGPVTTEVNAPVFSNDMMDLFGGGPTTQTSQPETVGGANDLMGILGGSGASDLMGFGGNPTP